MYKPGPRAPFKPPRRVTPSQSSSNDTSSPLTSSQQNDNSRTEPSKVNTEINRPESRETVQEPVKRLKPNPILVKETRPSNTASVKEKKYMVQWRKYTTKKNKTWDGDGMIIVNDAGVTFMCDSKGDGKYKQMGKTSKSKIDGIIAVGQYELEIDYEVADGSQLSNSGDIDKENNLSPEPKSALAHSQFKKVVPSGISNDQTRLSKSKRNPLHDPGIENSLVMKRPPNKKHEDIIDVVVDPVLTRELRPHQTEGVSFLYECLMGFRDFKGNGALLADEMGLGKTLTTITLIWTLLKQTPFIQDKSPICKKILITCPVTLIGNWKKEFKKWLDMNRIGILAINNKQNASMDKQDIKSFGKTRIYQVLIMSYEKVLTCKEELSTINFDMLVCDEGHRLKNGSNKVLKVLTELNIAKKVLLTGTPIQNDLVEFYSIINFINPGILGSLQLFQKNFIKPILRSREVNCINKDTIRRGESKSMELIELTKEFTLRRTSNILSEYLTAKTDIILFCPPTDFQKLLFKVIINSPKFSSLLGSDNFNNSLALITLFKKICNSPSLLAQDKLFNSLMEHNPNSSIDINSLPQKTASGKINMLIPLLIEINKVGEKTVLISNYTQTLDLLENVLKKLNITFSRLDGSTPNKQRDSLVNKFNNSSVKINSVFLLSAKSGGMGLNLIGGSRLILFDNDWNPSIDLQAMARIHRDGQKKPVYIYRIITTGCIDEKIFQRQLMKNNLSDKFLDNKQDSKSNLFDASELKDIFTINNNTLCNTHDLLQCECSGVGDEIHLDSVESDTNEDPEDDTPMSGGWITALDYKQEDQKPKKQSASIRNALLDYKHYDPKNLSIDMDCGDMVTNNIIKTSRERTIPLPTTYMLTKFSNSQL